MYTASRCFATTAQEYTNHPLLTLSSPKTTNFTVRASYGAITDDVATIAVATIVCLSFVVVFGLDAAVTRDTPKLN